MTIVSDNGRFAVFFSSKFLNLRTSCKNEEYENWSQWKSHSGVPLRKSDNDPVLLQQNTVITVKCGV